MAYFKREEQPFNMAIASLMRLDGELQKANFFSSQGHSGLINWFNALNCLSRELYPYVLSSKRKDGILKLIKSASEKSRIFAQYYHSGSNISEQQKNLLLGRKASDFQEVLDNLNRELITLMYEKGIIMPPKEDARTSMQIGQ